MGESTVVDTGALAAAGSAASKESRDVEVAVAASGRALARLAGELPGAASAPQVTAVRQASDGVLGDLARALGRLGGLLAVAALQYEDAEESATTTASGGKAGTGAGAPPARGRVTAL